MLIDVLSAICCRKLGLQVWTSQATGILDPFVWVRQLTTFWTIYHAFLRSTVARRVVYNSKHPCSPGADWCLQSDVMSDLGLQATCLRFMHSSTIADKATTPDGAFLIAMYDPNPDEHVKPVLWLQFALVRWWLGWWLGWWWWWCDVTVRRVMAVWSKSSQPFAYGSNARAVLYRFRSLCLCNSHCAHLGRRVASSRYRFCDHRPSYAEGHPFCYAPPPARARHTHNSSAFRFPLLQVHIVPPASVLLRVYGNFDAVFGPHLTHF